MTAAPSLPRFDAGRLIPSPYQPQRERAVGSDGGWRLCRGSRVIGTHGSTICAWRSGYPGFAGTLMVVYALPGQGGYHHHPYTGQTRFSACETAAVAGK